MALPAGLSALGTLQGVKGDTGALAFMTGEVVAPDAPFEVEMIGPQSNRGAHVKMPRGLPGLNGVPTDEAVATYAGTPGTALNGQLIADFAPTRAGVSAVQRFLKKLRRAASDVKMLVVGDSTGNETTEWVYLLCLDLAVKYPTHTVRWNLWNDTAKAYDTPVVMSTGTGPRVLDVFNLSVAGWTTSAPISAPFTPGIATIQPDLTLISMGHNEANVAVTNGDRGVLIGRYLALTESITAACPNTGMVVIAQNPSRADGNQAIRADVYERIASLRGYGFIDVHQHYVDAGTPSAWYADLVHPNATGEAEWAAVVAAHFVEAPEAAPLVRLPSSLLEPTENLLTNGDFASFAGATPSGWTNNGATVSKETGAGNFEAKHGYSVKVAPAGAAPGSISQAIGIPQTEALRGQWVTLAARVKIPNAVSGAGRISLSGAGTGLNSDVTSVQTIGGFTWIVLTTFVAFNAPNITVFLHGEVGSTGGGIAYFDRAILCRGMFPRDIALAA